LSRRWPDQRTLRREWRYRRRQSHPLALARLAHQWRSVTRNVVGQGRDYPPLGTRRRRGAWNSCGCWKPAEEAVPGILDRRTTRSSLGVQSRRTNGTAGTDAAAATAGTTAAAVAAGAVFGDGAAALSSRAARLRPNKEALDLCERLTCSCGETELTYRLICRIHAWHSFGFRTAWPMWAAVPNTANWYCSSGSYYQCNYVVCLSPSHCSGCCGTTLICCYLWLRMISKLMQCSNAGTLWTVAARWWPAAARSCLSRAIRIGDTCAVRVP
jgi:hypothetical protein